MFDFTYQERKVILFLIAVALFGSLINFLNKYSSKTEKNLSYLYQNLGKLNLNTVDEETLIDIPEIGKILANRIIEYRHKNFYFKSIEELKNIKGITRLRYEKIKDYFYLP